ncbi:hypothetical protein COLO4_34253 [Corchorus olitorius]|uniref:Uncharacterized protein n=1 Tax=Corchorus olitorius TaxID=93759 RepID=A0A1R3GMG7_9ROSI|nr:hypothetical protein COLO4_34253 [Corchorus olitorius]
MTLTRRIPTKTESLTTFRSGQLSHPPPSRPKLQILKPKWRGKRSMKEENGYTEARISKGKGARGSNGGVKLVWSQPEAANTVRALFSFSLSLHLYDDVAKDF